MKIHEAAEIILKKESRPIHIQELVRLIENAGLFRFGAKDPASALDVALARRSRNVRISRPSKEKLFYRSSPATYGLIAQSIRDDIVYPKQLYIYLKENIPSSDSSFVGIVDRWFDEDGRLEKAFLDSLVFYVCRRLIVVSQSYVKQCLSSSGVLNTDTLRMSIVESLEAAGFSNVDIEKLAWLLVQCVRESRNRISSIKVCRVINDAERKSVNCYICGSKIDYTKQDKFRSPEVEHIWPKSLGGPNSDNNLAIACTKCNQNKKNKLGAADFHFESIIYKKEPSNLSYEHKVSLLLKNDCSCVFCGQSSAEQGGLEFITSNNKEGWHFLNVETCCSEHAGELYE